MFPLYPPGDALCRAHSVIIKRLLNVYGLGTLLAMTLREYLQIKKISAGAFASSVGFSRAAVVKWMRNERQPKRDAMARIMSATNGEVMPSDFFDPPTEAA